MMNPTHDMTMTATTLLTNFAVCRAAQVGRLAAVVIVPGPHACAQVREIADKRATFDPRSIPLLPVWDCDRDERCKCGWRAIEQKGEATE